MENMTGSNIEEKIEEQISSLLLIPDLDKCWEDWIITSTGFQNVHNFCEENCAAAHGHQMGGKNLKITKITKNHFFYV